MKIADEDAEDWVLALAERTHEHAPQAVRDALATLAQHLPHLGPESDLIRAGRVGVEHAERCLPIDWVPGLELVLVEGGAVQGRTGGQVGTSSPWLRPARGDRVW
jgi:hypothetical protein